MIPSRSFLFNLHAGAMEMPAHSIDRPQRLVSALEAVGGARSKRLRLSDRKASATELQLAHAPEYVAGLREIDQLVSETGGEVYLDPELRMIGGSYDAARAAAGAAVEAAETIARSGTDRETTVMLNRPGSHHAGSAQALGFCLFNNLAIAAAKLLELGARRVAVFDFDAHHGNGTEEIFYEDPRVLTISMHQSPFFPGGGGAERRGAGEGAGFNLNLPLEAGASDSEGEEAFRSAREELREFQPEVILLEAGLDAHAEDWTTGLEMSDQFFYYLGRKLSELQDELGCGMAVELGGGYTEAAVKGGFEALLRGLD